MYWPCFVYIFESAVFCKSCFNDNVVRNAYKYDNPVFIITQPLLCFNFIVYEDQLQKNHKGFTIYKVL